MRTEPRQTQGLSQLFESAADDPADTLGTHFDLLGDETRLGIIHALYCEQRAGSTPIAFSALCDRTGIEDTGQFNYHLTRLCGPFVEKVPEGYSLTPGLGPSAGFSAAGSGSRASFSRGAAAGTASRPGVRSQFTPPQRYSLQPLVDSSSINRRIVAISN